MHFQAAKSGLIQCARELEALALKLGDSGAADRARGLSQKLGSEEFNLAIFGQFKRGKSTLINALVGSDILPSAVTPLTSVVTALSYGPEPRAAVTFADGRREAISLAEISDYATERDNPQNEKGVRKVEVSYPAQLLGEGIRLVDTPGIGSAFLNNTEIAREFLPEADAAILVLAADQPIGQAEIEFLRELRQHAAKFFFVLNKIDLLDQLDLEESLRFCRRIIEREMGAERVALFPVSAKLALLGKLREDPILIERSRIYELERALAQFSAREKVTALLETTRRRLSEIALMLNQAVKLELAALMLEPRELAEKMDLFRQQAALLLQGQRDVEYMLRGEVERLIRKVEADVRELIPERAPLVQRRLASAFNANKNLGKDELIEAMMAELARAVEEAFDGWRDLEDKEINREMISITRRFERHANQFVESVRDVAARLFGVEVAPIIAVEPLSAESRHYYVIESPFALHAERLPLLLPGRLAKPIIYRRFIESARLELERNAGRWRSDFEERIWKSAERFLQNFRQQVSSVLCSLEDALERAARERAQSESRAAAALERLRAAQGQIEELRCRIERFEAKPAHEFLER